MRAEPATTLTAFALTAGLVVFVGAVAGTARPAASSRIADLGAIELEQEVVAAVGVDGEKFLLASYSPDVLIDAAAIDKDPVTLPGMFWLGADAQWDSEREVLCIVGGNGLTELELSDPLHPQERHPGAFVPAQSFALTGGASFVGTSSGQVFRFEGATALEQRFNAGAVAAIAAVGGSVVAYVQDRSEQDKGTLYVLNADDLSVVAQQPISGVERLLAVDATHFLMLDDVGLHVGTTDGKGLSTTLEIEGVQSLSRNSHDGFFVVSGSASARLMRLNDGRASVVRTLDRRPMVDAAFNDDLLAVIYSNDKRKVSLYRVVR